MKIAIIDFLGLPYDPTTLSKRGLGGSESAVIKIAYELAILGQEVTVFNKCGEDDTKPGAYGVEAEVNYRRLNSVSSYDNFDIVISSRSLFPFTEGNDCFRSILKNKPLRVLWMHDTFVQGSDHVLEEMIVKGQVDEIFTLSDFHTDYVSTCNHGAPRMFETLKPHIFQTRNGADAYFDYVDISKKDPNHFVFNASYTKGMEVLVKEIWPRFKSHVHDASLTVIGGYYRFPDREADQQQKDWSVLSQQNHPDVTFTGVITQHEIAKILADASYFVAVGGFPETYGISILEALLYNTPIICNRFGAAEETAIDSCSYKLDYAVEPNSLWPHIPKGAQIDRFVEMMIGAYQNRYLWQQKAHACNIVKPLAPWSTVALQWKQHFLRKLGFDMLPDELEEVTWINKRVHTVFNRRFANVEDYGF